MQEIADEIDIALQIDPELIEPIVTIRVSRLECNRTENIPLIGMELIEFSRVTADKASGSA